jgi:hypothetical protein
VLWLGVFSKQLDLDIMNSIGNGSKRSCVVGILYICWVWQLCGGPYGKLGIRHVLRRKLLITLTKLCVLMRYWAGLYPESTQHAIGEVVDLMIRMAIQLLGKQNKKRRLMLTDGRCSSEDSDDREGSDAA